MEIIWDPQKQEKLSRERKIEIEEIKALIESKRYLDILENPTRKDQFLFVLEYKAYIHIAVVKIEPNKLVIKTCYPSRKAAKKYSGK